MGGESILKSEGERIMPTIRSMTNDDLLAYQHLCSICYTYTNSDLPEPLPEERLRIRRGFFDDDGSLRSAMMQIPYDVRFANETVKLVGIGGENGGMRPNMGARPEGMMPPEMQDGERPEMPEGFAPGKERPSGEGTMPPAGFGDGAMDMERPESPDGIEPAGGRWPGSAGGFGGNTSGEASEIFTIREGANYFSNIAVKN